MNVKEVMDFGTRGRQKCKKAKRRWTGGISLGDCEQTTSNVAASTWLAKNHLMKKHHQSSIHHSRKQEGSVVVVREAYKRYTPKSIILNGLSMTVNEGSIYGLLGPSGCGKTTLLSCIMGMRQLDSGTITLSLKHKVQVGFMPQDISLNTEFTIDEVFHFYGRIYEMSIQRIEQRGAELAKFLELPQTDRMIGNCSGGQQRRVSMAVTLLHDPQLLILDEPTVGVDPLLSNSIWEHFINLVNEQGKTIIITTHYIEEARCANTIALMRGGVLLAEEPPEVLMERYHCDSLESVFLKLSEKQEDTFKDIKPYPSIEPNYPPLQQSQMFNTERFKAQFIKNFNWTKRNLPVTIFVICLPALLFTIISQLSVKDGGDYPIRIKPFAVINDETDCFNYTTTKLAKYCTPTRPLSCRYLDNLRQLFELEKYESVEDGIEAVRRNHAMGVLQFEKNFSIYLMERIIEQSDSSAKALDGSCVQAWLDMTEFGHTVRTVRELSDRILELVRDVCIECGFNPKIAAIPIDERIYPSTSIMQAMVIPYFGSVTFYTAMMYTSQSIVMERSSGLFERSQAAGLTMFEIVTAQVVIQMVVMAVQNFLSFIVLYGMFSYPMRGNIGICILLSFLMEICGMTYGFLLAIVIHVEKNVAYAGIFTVLTLFMMTGSMWPLEAIHWLLKPMSQIVPVTLSSKGYYNVALRGFSITHYGVYMGIFSSLIGTIVLATLIVLAIKFKFGSLV
ncbi:ABC transporter G family member 23-like isoform X2 [Cimex lectularius]|uniref:ABC transporter domain-containing protein n=1 Tax=Cimex lectularius TaxID=79782 RepID=A0A8I6SPZ8_CIMLE|nr:ABC transporter G family member 23-like isoform X2 [Cimex lectularius]